MELRFILVSHCNYDCYFCLNEYFGSKSSKYTLTAENYKEIAKAAKSLSINRITLTGGEPTLRKDLIEIVSGLKSEDMHVTMITNGHILDKRLVSLHLIDELHVSFHAMTDVAWYMVTKNKGGLTAVKDNIISARKTNPALRIKLNIVSLVENNTKDQIQRYLDFARKYNLELNIFQEGYFKMLDLLGIQSGDTPKPAKWWDLSLFDSQLVENRIRKQVYDVGGVKVALSYTSTDKISWDSIWVDPNGGCYCDVKQESPVLDLNKSLSEDNQSLLRESLSSVLIEAVSHQREDQEALDMVIKERSRLPTKDAVPVGNLFNKNNS